MQPPRPFVLGAEFAGVVVTAPPGSSYKPGDRVFGHSQGAYGERIVALSDSVVPLPDALSFDQGAGASLIVSYAGAFAYLTCPHHRLLYFIGISITYPTSYEALVGRGKLQAGKVQFCLTLELLRNSLLYFRTGEWLLVLAAAGGVGIAAIQIGKGAKHHPTSMSY